MERLTFVDEDGMVLFENPAGFSEDIGFTIRELAENEEWETLDIIAQRLANCEQRLKRYEDLEEQGLLLHFPCKIRDTVYVDSKTIPTENMDFEEVKDIPLYFKAIVVSFRKNSNGTYIKLKVIAKWLHEWIDPECGPDISYYEVDKYFTYPLSAIGKTVFLTQVEAEKALAEMEANE